MLLHDNKQLFKPNNNTFYSGTSGLVLPVPQSQYPVEFYGKSRLTYYASLFNSVEINSTFYKLPRQSTIIKWAESVPGTFRFTFKLSKTITHVKKLDFKYEDLELFIQAINNIGDKRACILIQLPPALKTENISRLQNLLTSIKKLAINDTWKIAVEFRNKNWYNEDTYSLLKQHNISMVMHDLPDSATPLTALTSDFIYVRFHGTEKGYRGNYANNFLKEYAQHIKLWMSAEKTVYVYFNNTLGNAVNNLQMLNSLVL